MKTLINTTVLSNFAAVGSLYLLRQLFDRIYVSNEVYDEILDGELEGYSFYTDIDQHIYPLAEDGWIELVAMAGEEELKSFRSLPRHLARGEASSLAIARHRGWAFLTDDKLARKRARAWKIKLSGTLGVLTLAVKRGLLTLDAGNQLLEQMIARGYYSPYVTLQPLLQVDE